ncbi:hypothetical protein CKO51_31615 [Rhodopirellula sp. SM50]|nr:hypothetical protein CKO51_31615 [Rhodopirellula sp. SM50]
MRVRQAQVLTTSPFRRIGRVTVNENGWRIIEFTGRGSVFVGDRRQQVRGKNLGSRELCVSPTSAAFFCLIGEFLSTATTAPIFTGGFSPPRSRFAPIG